MTSPPETTLPNPQTTRRELRELQRPGRRRRPKPRRPADPRRTVRSALVATVLLPGMLAPAILPSFALSPIVPPQAAIEGETPQSLVADGVPVPSVERDAYVALPPQAAVGGRSYEPALFAQYIRASSEGWWRPVAGPVTSVYGPRRLICNGAGCSSPFHEGVDFGDACGTPVRATTAGTVTFVGDAGAFGQRVIVDHGGGVSSFYGHLQTASFEVAEGDAIDGGDTLALVGQTGVVTGCHLDLKFTVDDANVDPADFLAARGVDATKR